MRRGARATLAVPTFVLALALIVVGIGIVVAAWLLLKLIGVALIVTGFWLIRKTEDFTGASKSDP